MMTSGVIFDLDGTLWDSCAQVLAAWNRALARCFPGEKQLTHAELAGYMGKTSEEIAALMMPARCSAAERAAAMGECFREEMIYLEDHPGVLYPGVADGLRALQARYPLFIASNCEDGYIQVFLRSQGLGGCFADYEMSGRTHRSKGENVRALMARNGLTRAVLVGDTAGDRAAAEFAGIPFIYAAYGFGRLADEPYRAADFAEAAALAARLLG